ncbi:MAG: NusG domain II-containing protein [Firmicutes bacterium]|mgnify:CR=1 FL=1|nr:NusG domain II-containing protein [Bacillota bacterium]
MALRLRLADLAIIIAVLLVGLGSLWHNLSRPTVMSEEKYVALYVDNEFVTELSLSEHYLYEFTFGTGEYRARLEVDRGRVRMLPLERELCPRGICSHTGWISEPYESIVCLPNRILVSFTRGPFGGDHVDRITY